MSQSANYVVESPSQSSGKHLAIPLHLSGLNREQLLDDLGRQALLLNIKIVLEPICNRLDDGFVAVHAAEHDCN